MNEQLQIAAHSKLRDLARKLGDVGISSDDVYSMYLLVATEVMVEHMDKREAARLLRSIATSMERPDNLN